MENICHLSGAIPELADYRVVAEPDQTVVGSVDEDFAVESLAGDIFLLGNGGQKRIGGIKGLGVYGELDQRRVTLPLDPDAPAIGPGSRVKIVYTDDELKPGTVLAETEATIS